MSASSEGSESTDGGPTVIPSISIANNFDDGTIVLDPPQGTWQPSGEPSGLGYLGEYPLGDAYYGYFRFILPLDIPAGAMINTAVLVLPGHGDFQWDPLADALSLYVERASDSEQVASADRHPDMGGTLLNSEAVRWPTTGGLLWDAVIPNVSPDLSELVQSLVDDYGGLEQGSSIQFWVRKETLGVLNSEVGYVDYSSQPGNSATLEITFF